MHNSQSSKKITRQRGKKRLVRSHHSWYFPSGEAATILSPGLEQKSRSSPYPWLRRREKPCGGERTSTSKQCLCSHPPPHPCVKEASLVCPKKDLGKKTRTKPNKNTPKKPTMTLKAKCQAQFPRAEFHQQVVVGQSCSDLALTYPQCCYQFFHVVEKLEHQGKGSVLQKALGRASPLLQASPASGVEILLLLSNKATDLICSIVTFPLIIPCLWQGGWN